MTNEEKLKLIQKFEALRMWFDNAPPEDKNCSFQNFAILHWDDVDDDFFKQYEYDWF